MRDQEGQAPRDSWRGRQPGPDLTPRHPALQGEPGAEPGHFGVCVDSLTSDKASVPIVLEKLLEHVEMHGLYTEGLYRKSGAANRTRELRQALQTGGHCGQVGAVPGPRHSRLTSVPLTGPTPLTPQTPQQSSWRISPSMPSRGC